MVLPFPASVLDWPFALGPARVVADPSGGLWWPAERTLIVADLHLEKGSSFARKGVLLPPYDTRATLKRLAAAIERLAPARVVALGDSFHDAEAADRLERDDERVLRDLVRRQSWFWIAGNHDPQPNPALGGEVFTGELALGEMVFRHEAAAGALPEVSGHYHPKAGLRVHGRSGSWRCFVTDGRRVILPAFGAYAGGLDVRDPALARWFPDGFTALLAGDRRVTAVPSALLGAA